ncbi:hypothetical protein JCM10213_002951 [Rhodosporidiobolus nylandii]
MVAVKSAIALISSLSLIAGARAHRGEAAHRRQARAEAASVTASGQSSATQHPSATGTQGTAQSAITAAPSKAKALAAVSALPLTQYTYSYADIPYQVNPYKSIRGPQIGYNQCNDTTKGDDALCQTLIANNISDFCLWGSSLTGSELDTIGDIEAAVVAYCTQDNHGARLIEAGAITGLQLLKTEYYIQWTGYIDQTKLHLQKDDTGGELDPHGADLLGNPLGGLVYSTGLPEGDNSTYLQASEWNLFIGGGVFCLKLCSANQPSGKNYCENTSDRMGCSYNMPAAYKDGEFSECDSELQDIVGYYEVDGVTSHYQQPPEGTAPNPPYTPRIPSSSNCKTYQSTELFAAATTSAASSSSATETGKTSSGAASQKTGSPSGSAAGASSTSGTSDAVALVAGTGVIAALVGALAVLA